MELDQHPFDCIIIGGGFAGLAAALDITRTSSFKPLILEARSCLGGRARTQVEGLPQPVDLGCSFIHGFREGNPMTELAHQFKIDVAVGSAKDTLLVDSEGPMDPKKAGHLLDLFDQTLARVKSRCSDTKTPSREALAFSLMNDINSHHSGHERQHLSQLTQTLEVGAGIPLEDVSSRYFAFPRPYCGTDGAPTGGYQTLVDAMVSHAKEASVRFQLDEKVTSIVYDQLKGIVVLETVDPTDSKVTKVYRTRACVSTIPLGVLKDNPPAFVPPLDLAIQTVIKSTSVGILNKVVLTYPHAWWPSPESTGKFIFLAQTTTKLSSAPNGLESTLQNTTFWADNLAASSTHPHCTLVIPLGASAAQAIERHTDSQVVESIHDFLARRLSPTSTAPSPVASAITRWGSDAYARGATSSPVSLGKPDDEHSPTPLDFVSLSRSIWDGRLGFGGEHTDLDHRGSVAGALLSGQREARRVVQLLNSSSV